MQWAACGVGPFVVHEHIGLARASVDGRAGTFDHSSAYAQWGEVMLELIALHGSPTLAAPDGIGLHHVAHFVGDLAEAAEHLDATGCREVLRAETTAGLAFAWHDSRSTLGHLTEVYEPTDRLVGLYGQVRAAAESWDGARAIIEP